MGTLACLVSGIALSGMLTMAYVDHVKRAQPIRRHLRFFESIGDTRWTLVR